MQKIGKKTIVGYIAIVTLGPLLMLGFVRSRIVASEAFKVASIFVKDDPQVSARLGLVSDVQLAWYALSGIESGTVDGQRWGEADLSLRVRGARQDAKINIDLHINEEGKWEVVALDGDAITEVSTRFRYE